MVMIANKEWKYIFMTGKRDLGLEYATGFGAPGIFHFLYDQVNDPRETTNLAHNPDYVSHREKLQQDLLNWFMETHPYANELPKGLSTDGQLMWFAEPRDVGAEYGGRPLRITTAQ
jgi:choline-sulfatase